MTYDIFQSAINELYIYFRLTNLPADHVLKLWHRDVGNIPEIALPLILKMIKKNDSLPRNICKAFIAGWMEYKETNRSQIIYEKEDCSDCNGVGLLWAMKNGYKYVQPCRCLNSNKHFHPSVRRATKQGLIDDGFTTTA